MPSSDIIEEATQGSTAEGSNGSEGGSCKDHGVALATADFFIHFERHDIGFIVLFCNRVP